MLCSVYGYSYMSPWCRRQRTRMTLFVEFQMKDERVACFALFDQILPLAWQPDTPQLHLLGIQLTENIQIGILYISIQWLKFNQNTFNVAAKLDPNTPMIYQKPTHSIR